MTYIPLHVHDQDASVGDSILDLEAYVKKGKTYGLPALAITNHGSLSSMYKFYQLCKDAKIKPIIGNEIYVNPDTASSILKFIQTPSKKRDKSITLSPYSHLVLLAQNEIGLKNLLYLTSFGATQTFYKKPLVPEELVFKHSEGLICLTACIGGAIPKMILQDKPKQEILEVLKTYAKYFPGRFYLELQPCKIIEQTKVNMQLAQYAKELNLPVVATNDMHYLNKEDAIIHNIHVADCRKQVVLIDDDLIYKDDCFYFMKEEEVQLLGVDLDIQKKAIENTCVIADQCEMINLPDKVQMPIFNPNFTAQQAKEKIYELAFKKLNTIIHYVRDPYEYTDRLIYELGVIEKLGFIDYFLIIWDVMRYAKEHHIKTGPGRGSVVGSLLAYLLEITKVDPIRYHLIFERFLSEYRVGTVPDIDLDITSSKRDEIFDYVQQRYGHDHCALVSTKTIRKAKGAIKDAGRALNIPNHVKVCQSISDLIPTTYYDDLGEKETDLDIERALEVVPELRQYEQQYPKLFEMAIGLQNKPKSNSVHAAGILIFPYPLEQYLPLRLSNTENMLATSLNLKDAENVAIKFDFLGLATLDMLQALENETGFVFDYDDVSLFKDEWVWNLIGSEYNSGLFQISSNTYRKRMQRLKPKTIEELAACLALVRGPCISNKLDETYMLICEKKKEIEYIHPIYDEATQDTLGVMIYQEQAMKLFENAGMPKEDSFKLMKLLGKKKLDKAKAYKEDFYKGCRHKQVDLKTIDYMWDIVENSSKYSFNKSHAIAYAVLCYITAYYKVHYCKEFFTVLLTHEFTKKSTKKETHAYSLKCIMKEIKDYGFKIILPDINDCQEEFINIPDTPNIMAGTCAIKYFGKNLDLFKDCGKIESMKDLFKDRPAYGELETKKACEEVWKTIPVPGKTSVIAAIFAGAFDNLPNFKSRKALYDEYMKLREIYCGDKYTEEDKRLIKMGAFSVERSKTDKTIEKELYTVNLF